MLGSREMQWLGKKGVLSISDHDITLYFFTFSASRCFEAVLGDVEGRLRLLRRAAPFILSTCTLVGSHQQERLPTGDAG